MSKCNIIHAMLKKLNVMSVCLEPEHSNKKSDNQGYCQ